MSSTPPASATAPSLADFDEIEKSLGISEYMSPSAQGFSAVVKARYSDFVVHEVGLDGSIARLTSRDIPKTMEEPAAPSKEVLKPPEKPVEESNAPSVDDWPSLQSQLQEMIKDAAVAEQAMTMLEKHNKKKTCKDKFVTLPALEKPERKAIHDWVRESLSCARADTLEGRIRIWHVRFEKEMPNFQSFGSHKRGNDNRNSNQPNKRNKKSWPEDRPEFLQFVLYKENIDTTTATKELMRKGSKARMGYAGMKDKRGITTQFCTMFRTEPQQIVGDRQAGGGGNTKQNGYAIVQVGNFEYVSKEMRLGTLRGNRFDLVLRNVQTGCDDETKCKEILEKAAHSTKELGFINYFGTQRFGKYQDTHLVSKRLYVCYSIFTFDHNKLTLETFVNCRSVLQCSREIFEKQLISSCHPNLTIGRMLPKVGKIGKTVF
jgi:tRNA pseudouridine13 synthase